MTRTRTPPFNPQTFLSQVGSGKTTLTSPKKQILFSQGDAADAVFYIQAGKVKLTVVSQQGKEAVVAMLEPGSFFRGRVSRRAAGVHGHGDRRGRLHVSCALTKTAMIRVLHDEPAFSELFLRPISWLATFASKRTWWINSSIPARSGWRGCCC